MRVNLRATFLSSIHTGASPLYEFGVSYCSGVGCCLGPCRLLGLLSSLASQAELRQRFGQGRVTFTEKRKSAEFLVMVQHCSGLDATATGTKFITAAKGSGRHREGLFTGALETYSVDNFDDLEEASNVQQVMEVQLRQEVRAQEWVLSADVLFENATHGRPLSEINALLSEPEAQEAACMAVQMMKLFQRKVGGRG